MKFKFLCNQRVQVTISDKIGFGYVKGIATCEFPVIGSIWIVELYGDDYDALIDSTVYPFNCVAIPECNIKSLE